MFIFTVSKGDQSAKVLPKDGMASELNVKENEVARKRAMPDSKNSNYPNKKKQGKSPVQYYTSLSAALKEATDDTAPNKIDEPFKVFLPPTEVNAGEYKPTFEMLANLESQISQCEDRNAAKENTVPKNVDSADISVTKKTANQKSEAAPRRRKKKKRPSHGSRRSSSSSSSSSSGI